MNEAAPPRTPRDLITGLPHQCNIRCNGKLHASLVYGNPTQSAKELLKDAKALYARDPLEPIMAVWLRPTEAPRPDQTWKWRYEHEKYASLNWPVPDWSHYRPFLLFWHYTDGREEAIHE